MFAIIFSILMSLLSDSAVIPRWEDRCESLKGVKGLTILSFTDQTLYFTFHYIYLDQECVQSLFKTLTSYTWSVLISPWPGEKVRKKNGLH